MAKRQQPECDCEPSPATKYLKTDDKQFTCSICIEFYRNPRYLPTCGHTFCENCLLKYTRNIQLEQQGEAQGQAPPQGRKFECPICRKPNHLPEPDVTLQWVQTFPLNTVIIKMMEAIPRLSEEMRVEIKTCDPCKQEGEVTAGLKFCLDCKEVLCKTCLKCHKNFKMSKDHKLMNIPTENSNVDFFTDVGKCAAHPERDVEIFCKTHDAVVCATCLISDHKACEMIDIACHNIDMTRLRNDSEMLISRMKATIEHCNFLQNLRTENKNHLKQKLKEIREHFQQLRDKVNELMGNAIGHVSDVTKRIEIEREDELGVEMARVIEMKKLTEQSVAQFDAIKQYGSEKHKFVSARLMKKMFEETCQQIYAEDNHLKQLDAEMVLADNLTKLIESVDVENLVQIKVTETESSHKPLSSVLIPLEDTDDTANILRDCKLIKVEEHTICPEQDTKHDLWLCGIATHKDGRLILTDNSDVENRYGYLYVYNVRTRAMLTLNLTDKALGAAPIDDAHLALNSPHKRLITVVSVGDELKVERTLQTQSIPFRIQSLNNGQLAVAWRKPPAFSVLDISGETAIHKLYLDQDTNGRMFKSFIGLAVDERRQHVIQLCSIDRVVYCFDFTGEPVFTYEHPELKYPAGVVRDNCGNIYVLDNNNPGSIHKLSPTGEPISIITDGVPPDQADICSDATGTGFWVFGVQYDKVVHFRHSDCSRIWTK